MFWGKVAIFVVGDFIGNSGGTAGDYEVQHEANNFQVGKRMGRDSGVLWRYEHDSWGCIF